MDRKQDRYECVQPELGAELWRLSEDTTEPTLVGRLQRHLAICDSCRMERGIESRVQRGLRDETLRLRANERSRPWIRRLAWGGALATAASLVLLAGLPPRPMDDGARMRTGFSFGFVRPVEGEVVVTGQPTLRWSSIEGATSYEISLREVGGDYHWQGASNEPSLHIPKTASLPRGAGIRAQVRPVPRDLAAEQGMGVLFRTGNWADFASHRLRYAPRWVQALGVLGLLLLAIAIGRRIL